MDRFPFLTKKEIKLVLTRSKERLVRGAGTKTQKRHWTAESVAIVVITQEWFRGVERSAGIKSVVAQEFEHRPMILISAPLGYHIDLGARISAIFGGKIRSLDLYFLNKIYADVIDLACVAAGVVIVSTINGEIIRNSAIAVDVDRVCCKICVQGIVRRCNSAGNKCEQLIIITTIQSKI